MIMADVLKFVFLIVGLLMVFVAYWLAAEALFPALVERARQQYQGHGWRITLVGLAAAVPLVALGFIVGQLAHPAAKMLGVALGSMPVLVGLVGSAGLSRRIGEGLVSRLDEQQPWRRVLRGSIVLALTFLLPVVGWFIVLPWTLISGFGAALLSCRSQRVPAVSAIPPTISATEQAPG